VNVVNYKKGKVHGKATTKLGKGVATNGNGLGVKFDSKKFKARLGKIEVVVHVNKVAHP